MLNPSPSQEYAHGHKEPDSDLMFYEFHLQFFIHFLFQNKWEWWWAMENFKIIRRLMCLEEYWGELYDMPVKNSLLSQDFSPRWTARRYFPWGCHGYHQWRRETVLEDTYKRPEASWQDYFQAWEMWSLFLEMLPGSFMIPMVGEKNDFMVLLLTMTYLQVSLLTWPSWRIMKSAKKLPRNLVRVKQEAKRIFLHLMFMTSMSWKRKVLPPLMIPLSTSMRVKQLTRAPSTSLHLQGLGHQIHQGVCSGVYVWSGVWLSSGQVGLLAGEFWIF